MSDHSTVEADDEQLQPSEEQFRQLASNLDEVVWLVSADLRKIYYISPAFERVWGRTAKSLYDDPRSWIEAVHPDDRQRVIQSVEARLHGERHGSTHMEYRIVRPDGSIRWIRARSFTVKMVPRHRGRLVGIAEDITEQHLAAAALRESEEKLRTVLENVPEFILRLDRDGTIQFINRTIPGFTSDRVVNSSAYDYLPDNSRDQFHDALERVFREGVAQRFEMAALGPDGSTSWYHTCLAPIVRDGQVVGATAVATDLTKRRRTELILRDHAQILSQISDAVVSTDLDGVVQTWNQGAERIYGYQADEVIGRRVDILHFPEDAGLLHDLMETCRQRGANDATLRNRRRAKDGREIFVELRLSLRRDENGNPIGFIGCSTDITRRWRAEEALQRAHADLERRVADRTAELTSANEQLAREVAEREQAERALHDSQSAMRTVLDAFPDAMFRIGNDGTFLEFRGASGDLLILPPERLIGHTIREVMPAWFADLVMRHVAQALETGELQKFEYQLPVPLDGGEMLDFEARLIVVGDDEVVALVRNITDQKRAEQAVRDSQARLQSILDNTTAVIYVKDTDGRYQLINRRFEELFHVTNQGTVGKTDYDLFPPEMADAFRENDRRVIESGRPVEFQEIAPQDDGPHTYISIKFPLRSSEGKSAAVCGISTDITYLKRAQDALGDSEQRYRLLAEFSNDLISRHAPDGTILFVSPACRALYGFEPEEFVGRDPFELVHPDDRDLVRTVQQTLQQGQDSYTVTYRGLHKDGHYVWTESTGRVVRDDDTGEIREIINNARDISERKEAEAALQQEQQLLRKLIDLQERERQLIAYEIHDGFIQKVVGAQMHLESCLAEVKSLTGAPTDQMEQAIDWLRRAVTEGRRMISGLRPLIIDEEGIVAAIEYLIGEEREQGSTRIEFEHDVKFNRLAPLLEGAMFRIVQEALTNIRRHSEAEKAVVKLNQDNGLVRLEVRDWGVGFDPEQVASTRFGVRGIIERARLFGGCATIESEPGKGTRIVAELPVSTAPEPAEN